MYEIQPSGEFIQEVSKKVCKEEAITSELCTNIIFLMGGPSYEQLNRVTILYIFVAYVL